MANGLTQSEKFVTSLCERAFLRLWTHPNPRGKKGKELCDCLIVCGPHIVIISVKENDYRDTGDTTGWDRWRKDAIEKSVQQIWGAERWLKTASEVHRADGRQITLPPANDRQYHRISVSLGARGEVPLSWGEFGNGFVHVLDEFCLKEVFRELDTISDFIAYLGATEGIFTRGIRPIFADSGVEDLLALYVQNGSSFGFVGNDGAVPDTVLISGGIWKALISSPEYARRNQDLKSSYAWDNLIELFADDLLNGGMFDMHSKKITNDELALIEMALQPRGHRANLADAFIEFLDPKCSKVAARFVLANNHTAFVFLAGSSNDRASRSKELELRCLVVRGRCPNVITVVGIATDRPGSSKSGYSCDIGYVHMPVWTPELAAYVDEMQRDLGYFENARWPN